MRALIDRLIPIVSAVMIRLLYASMRIRHVSNAAVEDLYRRRRPFLAAFWHGQILMMVFGRYHRPIVTMVSRHRDGELVARTVAYFGAETARGSSTRGGASALRGMIAAAREGKNLAITPDGPKGPRHVAQPGVIQVAQATGLPIVPVAFISRPRTQMRSWDRFEVPHPFGRGIYFYGSPINVANEIDRDESEALRMHVQEELCRLSTTGERAFDELWEKGSRP